MLSRNAFWEIQIRRVAGILGIIQSSAWITISGLLIIFYVKPSKLILPESHMQYVGSIFYNLFLAREFNSFDTQILTPDVFFGYMVIYLISNLIWLYFSILCSANHSSNIRRGRRKLIVLKEKSLGFTIKCWSYITFCICLVDFLMVVILGADYKHCLGLQEEDQSLLIQLQCANGFLIVLVIAAKGFVLWIINFTFSIILYNISQKLKLQQLNNL